MKGCYSIDSDEAVSGRLLQSLGPAVVNDPSHFCSINTNFIQKQTCSPLQLVSRNKHGRLTTFDNKAVIYISKEKPAAVGDAINDKTHDLFYTYS